MGLPALSGPGQDVGLRYDYRYNVRFAGPAFDDAFFAYLTSIAVIGPIDPVMQLYNEQKHNRLDVGPQEAYIDANATEAGLETQSARRLGIAADQDTVFLVDWYGRPDFQFHTYYHLGDVDPDTGIDGGNFVAALTRAWGGNSGPTWFYDLSAGPDYGDNSWDVDDADLSFPPDGVLDYRMPPIWEYGNMTAYRPFNDLSGDLAKEIRYVALDMLFTPSPIYDPAATVPGPDGVKQIALDIFEGDPGRNGLGDVHPDVVQSTAQSLEPYYPVTFGATDRPLAGDVLDAYNISIGRSDAPGCPDFQQGQALGFPEAELSCYFRENRAEYFPAPAGNAVIPAIGLTVPDEDAVQAFGFSGSTDPDFQTGLPTFIYELDTPDGRVFPAIAYTDTTIHESGHYVGLSHPHDGYDSASGVDFEPAGAYNFAWDGDETATVMSYVPGNLDYDRFDRDNLARWDVGRLLDLADTDAAAILAAKPSAPVDALLVKADFEFARALAAMHASDWTAAATAAVAGYRDMQRADAAAGVTPASQRLAQLEGQNGNGNGRPALVPRDESARPINPKAWQPWGSPNTPKNPPAKPTAKPTITIGGGPGN